MSMPEREREREKEGGSSLIALCNPRHCWPLVCQLPCRRHWRRRVARGPVAQWPLSRARQRALHTAIVLLWFELCRYVCVCVCV